MARRRRYNPNQKRDSNGRWAKGSLSGTRVGSSTNISRSGAARTATGNTRRYDAYLAKQAREKQQARKKALKNVAIGAAVLGAAGVGAYVGSRGKSSSSRKASIGSVSHLPIAKEGPRVPIGGKPTTPKKMEVPSSGPRKVSSAPVVSKAVTGAKLAEKPKVAAKANPISAPVKTPVTTGVSTVAAERALVSLKRSSPKKANPTSNPVPTPGVLLTEDGKAVKVVKGLNDRERIALEQRAVQAASDLAKLERKAGINVGSQSRKEFDKKNQERRTKAQAAQERKDAAAAKRRAEMSKHIKKTMSVQNIMGSKLSARERAEGRYATILENMLDNGTALNRTQRTFLREYMGQ